MSEKVKYRKKRWKIGEENRTEKIKTGEENLIQ
jgi:hypothetical protein